MNHGIIFNSHTGHGASRTGGGHRIGSFLRSQGWDAEVIDYAGFWTLEELKELARSRISSNTIFFGFSPFFRTWPDHIEQYCCWIKENYPHIKIIVGGQKLPQLSKNVDYYIVGYAEQALLELIKHIIGAATEPIKFDSAYFGTAKVINATHHYPAYPMRNAAIIYEDRDYIQPHEWLTTEFSRGCKFKCPYCDFPVLGVKGDYTRDASDFDLQIRDAYDRFGVTNYICSDETFNDRTDKIIKFADVAEKFPFDLWISGFMRGDLLVSRHQDWEHLLRLNFLGQFYGIETTNWKSAKSIGKGMHPDKLLPGLVDAKNYFKTHGRQLYRGTVSFIVGLPHETIESQQKTFDWAINNWKGESVLVGALAIEKNYGFESLGPSEMSLDWGKFGYRESQKQVDHNITKMPFRGPVTDLLNWENNNMEFVTASRMANSVTQDIFESDDFTIPAFILGKYSQSGVSIEELLKLTVKSTRGQFADEHFENIRKNYINRKLNLSTV